MESENIVSKIKSAPDLGIHFRNQNNSKNIMLFSEAPVICKEESCILGVDEAGRGPVLGPMVYGISYCPLSNADMLKSLGCADSKTLTEKKREEVFEKLCKEGDSVGWAVEAISPTVICNKMLRRHKYSLNQIAQDSTVALINKAVELGVRVAEIYVDTVGPPEKYQERLSAIFPEFKITVAKKADASYPIVSAASICAKVSRDRALQGWSFKEGLDVTAEAFGSGYPGDPLTKKFLIQHLDPVFGFPQLVRFSWSTADKILQDHAVQVEWEEVDDEKNPSSNNSSITSFFQQLGAKKQKMKHRFFRERNLTTLETL